MRGIPSFFTPNLAAWRGTTAASASRAASYYSTAPLRETLADLIDCDYLCDVQTAADGRRGQRVQRRRCATSTAATRRSASTT